MEPMKTRRHGEKGSFEVKKLGKLEVMKIGNLEVGKRLKLRSWEDLWGRVARDNRARKGFPTIFFSAFG